MRIVLPSLQPPPLPQPPLCSCHWRQSSHRRRCCHDHRLRAAVKTNAQGWARATPAHGTRSGEPTAGGQCAAPRSRERPKKRRSPTPEEAPRSRSRRRSPRAKRVGAHPDPLAPSSAVARWFDSFLSVMASTRQRVAPSAITSVIPTASCPEPGACPRPLRARRCPDS